MTYHQVDDKGELTPFTGDMPIEAITAIERADDEAIVQSFSGGFAQEHYVYSYPISTKQGKKSIVGIGSAGAKRIALLLGNIEVLPDVRVQEKDDYFYGVVRVKDLLRNTTLAGFGRQSVFILTEGNEPTNRRDEHAYVKSLTKAQRNGILSVAPQEALVKIVKQFFDEKKLGRLTPPMQPNTPSTTKAQPATPSQQSSTKDTQPLTPPEEKGKGKAADKKASTAEMNKAKAAFMMKWHELQGYSGWDNEESDKQREEWLKTNFNVDSLTKLDKDQIMSGVGKINANIAAITNQEPSVEQEEVSSEATPEETTEDKPASVEEKREIAQQLAGLGQDRDTIRETFNSVTNKTQSWMKSDIIKLQEHIAGLKAEKEEAVKQIEEGQEELFKEKETEEQPQEGDVVKEEAEDFLAGL